MATIVRTGGGGGGAGNTEYYYMYATEYHNKFQVGKKDGTKYPTGGFSDGGMKGVYQINTGSHTKMRITGYAYQNYGSGNAVCVQYDSDNSKIFESTAHPKAFDTGVINCKSNSVINLYGEGWSSSDRAFVYIGVTLF